MKIHVSFVQSGIIFSIENFFKESPDTIRPSTVVFNSCWASKRTQFFKFKLCIVFKMSLLVEG